jgi:hypothetical protein
MSESTAALWFAKEEEFRQLCGDAVSQARVERAQEFAADMVKDAKELGLRTPLTDRQLRWLCVLADWDVPRRLPITGGELT